MFASNTARRLINNTKSTLTPKLETKNMKYETNQETYTYCQIANNFRLWTEYVDTLGLDSKDTFASMPEAEKIQILVECFGPES